MRFGAIAFCTMALAVCMLWRGVSAQSPASQLSVPLACTSAPQYDSTAWLRGGERFPAGALIKVRNGNLERPLVSGFGATADPAVFFDGTKILFAGRRDSKDSWQIWEVGASGGEAKRITSCTGDCVRPFYLPGGRFVYAHNLNHRYVLETAPLGGGTASPLTFLPGNAMPTDVLRDGRILFEASYPLASGSSSELYTVYSDGSGVQSYRCDHVSGRDAARQIVSGDVMFRTVNGLGRFTSPLAHEVRVEAPAGQYAGDVVQTPADTYILSWRPDDMTRYSLQTWDGRSNSLMPVIAANDADLVQPVLMAPRRVPNQHPSGLHDWNYANLLCLNAYTSKYQFPAGSISSMRLYTKTEAGKPKLLGSSSVEPDGSFFVKVPGDQPLQIELLDHEGKTVKREQGWFWMRKGEQRICVGCHSGPERAPENAVPAVLVKSTTPVDLTGSGPSSRKGGR